MKNLQIPYYYLKMKIKYFYWLRPPRSNKNVDCNKKTISPSKSLFITSVLAPISKKASSSSLLGSIANKNSTLPDHTGDIGGGLSNINVRNGNLKNHSEDKNWFQLSSVSSKDPLNYSGAKR